MKKKTKIIIPLAIILAITLIAFGVFCLGSTLFSDIFEDNHEIQARILEVQYKINKKTTVLGHLCSSLQMVVSEENTKYLDEFIYYSEIYLANEDDLDNGLYSQYLLALSQTDSFEKLQKESRNYLNKCKETNDFKILYSSLFMIKDQGNEQEQSFVKDFAKEVLDGSYIKTNSEEEFNELTTLYTELTK